MKKFFAILLCVVMVFAVVACDTNTNEETTVDPNGNTTIEAEYKLGMGIVVDMSSSDSKKTNAQVDATVATVVLDAEGKIVACRIDAVQNKMNVAGGAVDTAATFQTKMEKGNDYHMADWGAEQDNNGDGKVLEWYDQAKAFEAWVVGKTAAEVQAMPTQTLGEEFGSTAGYVISADADLLAAGCTIQVGDFVDAVVKACNDEQGMTFTTASEFTLGVAATSFVDAKDSKAATATENGIVAMYSDFAASVVADGVIIATLNDAIQPKIAITAKGECTPAEFEGTKRERMEGYNMAPAINYGPNYDPNNDGKVLEWYVQSEAFSNHVVGMTAAEVANMETSVNSLGYQMTTDADLLAAGCTIQITAIKAVVAKSANNAR